MKRPAATGCAMEASPRPPAAIDRSENNPAVILAGSSMVRDARINRCYTSCHPGTCTTQLNDVITQLLRNRPSVQSVVAHVGGINDVKLQQSTKLRKDRIRLIDNIPHLNKECVISGSFPPPSFDDEKFSRIMQLHVWLKGYCNSIGIPYTVNFTTFLHRLDLFRHDRHHLNRAGSPLLSRNIDLTLQSCKTLSN